MAPAKQAPASGGESSAANRAKSPDKGGEGSRQPAESGAKGAPVLGNKDSRPSTEGESARSPDEVCGGRVFIARALCMKRQCEKPRLRQHPQCVKFKQQEADQRKALEGA